MSQAGALDNSGGGVGGDVTSLTGDFGTNPVFGDGAGNINVIGQTAGSVQVMDTVGTAASFTLAIENRTWLTQYVVDPSAVVGLRGTFQTIQAAITAATAPANIFIRPGTYTENLTLKTGVNLIGFANTGSVSFANPNVTIVGKSTLTAGTIEMQNLSLLTNTDYVLDISGSATVNLARCFLKSTNSPMILCASGRMNILECNFLDAGGATNQFFVVSGASVIDAFNTLFFGTATTASTIAGSSALTLRNCTYLPTITTSGTSSFSAYNCTLGLASSGTFLTAGGTAVINEIYNSVIRSGTSVAITIGAGVTFTLSGCEISSTNTNCVTGIGTLIYNAIGLIGNSPQSSVTTQIPKKMGPLLYAGAFAGAYTTTAISYVALITDYIIGCTAGSITITLPATSMQTGQMFHVKDESGTAAASNITVTVAGGVILIDGATTNLITNDYGAITLYWNGSKYLIL